MKETVKARVVPFKIAKLLKEVGYDEKIDEFWAYCTPWTAKGGARMGGKYNSHYASYVAYSNSEWEKNEVAFADAFKLSSKHPAISAPSYDMAVDWVLEHLGVYVGARLDSNKAYYWAMTHIEPFGTVFHNGGKHYQSRYEAMDAAFLEILEKEKDNRKKNGF